MTIKPNKARFLVAVSVSAVVWFATLIYLFGTHNYVLGAYGFIRVYPHPLIVMIITTLMLGITFWMWRWYKMDRVSRALSGLDSQERRQLISLLQGAEQRLMMSDDGEFDLVLAPKKQKHEEANGN